MPPIKRVSCYASKPWIMDAPNDAELENVPYVNIRVFIGNLRVRLLADENGEVLIEVDDMTKMSPAEFARNQEQVCRLTFYAKGCD